MMKKLSTLLGVLAAVALVSVVAMAQQTPRQTRPMQQRMRLHQPQGAGQAMRGHIRHVGGMSQGAWGMGSTYNQRFAPSKVTTMSGRVTAITRFSPGGGSLPGIRLTVRSGNETDEVDLGPAWFIDHQSGRIARGAHVTVTGARVEAEHARAATARPEILAKTVALGDHEFVLRTDDGTPMWDAFRPREQPTASR